MNAGYVGILLVASAALGQQPAGGDDVYLATTAAARELSNQLMYLQQAFATIPGPPEGRGLYGQSDRILYDLSYFQQQLKQKVAREELYILFDKMDGKLTQLMSDLYALEQWSPALQMVARRVQAAEQDLHFALFSGNGAPAAQQPQVAYRQTLAMLARTRDLANLAAYVFTEPAAQKRWAADFVDLRRALVELQRLMQNNAGRDTIKKQLVQTDQVWEKLVARYKELPEGQNLLLGSDFAKVDRSFHRLGTAFGMPISRPVLTDGFSS